MASTAPIPSTPDLTVSIEQPEPVFALFPDLPIELRMKVWEHAFPARVVNLIYDQYHDRFHSFNSTPPLLLHVHRESREMGLKLYHLCFGTESFEARVYFDFNKDILLFDDYLFAPELDNESDPELSSYRKPLPFAEYPLKTEEESQIQRLALNSIAYHDIAKKAGEARGYQMSKSLQKFARPLVVKFAALQELNIVIEEINPYPRAEIRIFDIGHDVCKPICDICYISKLSEAPIKHLRNVYGSMLDIRLIGAYRGSSRFSLGCYDRVVETDVLDDISEKPSLDNLSDDDIPPGDDEDVGYSFDSDDSDTEESLGRHLWPDGYLQYDYEDVDTGFSDHSDEEDADLITPDEVRDILDDECLYNKLLDQVDGRQYVEMQDKWVSPEYYEVRMTL